MFKKMAAFLFLILTFNSLAFAELTQGDGRKTVSTAGTAEALSSTALSFTEVTICAETDNTGVIVVGTSPVASLSTREGVYLAAGDCYTISTSENKTGTLDTINLDTTVNGDGVTYHYFLQR